MENKTFKGSTVLNMIRRNLYFAPAEVKSKAYMATVRPILEYLAVCWSPASEQGKKGIERVQNNAAKFVRNYYPKKGQYEQFSVSSLVTDLGWDTIEVRRDRSRCTMVYKILNDEAILPPDILTRKIHQRPTRACTTVNVGPQNQLIVPHSWIIN